MDYRWKYVGSTIVLAIAAGMLIWALREMQIEAFSGHVSTSIKVAVFGSAIVAIIAALCRYYWRSMSKSEDGSGIALDAYAALGRQTLEEKKNKSEPPTGASGASKTARN